MSGLTGTEGQEDPINPLELSDEEFAKLPMPGAELLVPDEPEIPEAPVVETGADGASDTVVQPGGEGNEGVVETKSAGEEGKDPQQPAGGQEGAPGGAVQPGTKEEPKEPPAPGTPEAGKPAEGAVPPVGSQPEGPKPGEEKPKVEGNAGAPAEPLSFAQIGEMVMKPFKANGKMVELKSPDEAVKLMQMGAHFTQKMQAIQPHRRVLTMLENNDLLSEDKLSFLIDLDKKNPDAIRKLLKDSGIDPLEIDTTTEPTYQAGSHKVSDAEVNFRSAVEDLVSTPEGQEALQTFNTTWDQASKDVVWGDPSLLSTMFQQKQTGVYDAISSEVERRRMLGSIGPETPFLKAYEVVGAELHNAGKLNDIILKANPSASVQSAQAPQTPVTPAPVKQPDPTPVATRAAAPKQGADNNDKANAAAPTRSGSRPAKPIVNPLAMSDEEFLAQFKGRI